MFRMMRWQCYLYMMIHQATWLFWLLFMIITGGAVAGFFFSVWAGIVALCIGAFLSVMAFSFVMIAYGFNSVTGLNMTSHRLYSSGEKLVVEFDDGKDIEMPKDDLRPYLIYPGGIIVPLKGGRTGWVWVPPKAFDTDEGFKEFLKSLYENNSE